MTYNRKEGTLQVQGMPLDTNVRSCLRVQLTKDVGKTWENLTCFDANVEARRISDNDDVVFIRGQYCVRDICGALTAAMSTCQNHFHRLLFSNT